ncbi:MAG: hypothetical protein AAGF66_01170 [Cyanobacteria bacterium P01_H01_bin.119]
MSRSSSGKSLLSTQNLVLFCSIWGIFSLLFFLLFSVPAPGEELPEWYLLGITFLETGAFAIASALCLRNWKSAQIVSGRGVWLSIGLGLVSYTIGNILFFFWGNVWGLDPVVSLGDFFYIISYIFLAWGMLQAVLPRRLNLEISQWAIIVGVGLAGVAVAVFLTYFLSVEGARLPGTGAPAYAQAAPDSVPTDAAPPVADPAVEPAPAEAQDAPEIPDDPEIIEAVPAEESAEDTSNAPEIVVMLNDLMTPLEDIAGLLYLIGDCILVIIATTLLVAFWGGRFSQSWKLIAIAAFCLYIADMFFAYNFETYVEGQLWEVFWTFSAIFFALGAVVENDISSKSRRTPRRRRG